MGKRKEDPRRDDSSSISSDAKRRSRCRHYLYGEKKEETPSRDVLRVKLSIEEKFKRKFQKLKEKRKKDKNKHNEELRILKEDFRILKESHEDLKSKFHEMRKEGSAEVDQYKESPSQRSQLSQSTRFRLVIENSVSRTIYKNETVETEDGGGHIKVVMYDGDNPIAPDHPLASVKVELVVVDGWFNEPKRDSWSKEEFEKSILKPRQGISRIVKNGTFDLIRGSCDHQGAIIMEDTHRRDVRLGVVIAVHTEERVLEGLSNHFRVQEGKTKRSQKKAKQPSPPVPTPILWQPTSVYSTKQGQGPANPFHQHSLAPPLQKAVHGNHTKFPDSEENYPPPTVPLMVEGNGQDLNGNSQKSSQQILAQILEQSTSTFSIQHGQFYSWAPPSIQNQLQAAVYCPVNQPLLSCGQDQFTSFPNGSSELAFENPSMYASLNDTQSTFSPGDVRFPNVQTQMQDTFDWSFICGRVLLQWDNPHVKISERWNFLDQLMPLYITKSRFYGESFPTTSLIDKTHKLLGSIPSVGSVWKKKMASVTSRAMQTPQKRSVLIRPIEPYDSDDKPPFKKRRNARYQLRFVNTVCTDYYTREKIKSEDGTFLKVALYDENNLVVTSGPLSSASVEVILLHGDFNAEGQDYWTSEEFNTCLVHPQSAEEPPALGGDRVLALSDGEADLGNVNFQTSSFHARTGKFKMGAVIKNLREDNVQEGITSPFVVRVRLGEDHIHTTIFPPAILDSSICWNTNHNQLQQLASNNITTTPPAGSSGGGGSNNHPHPLSQNGSMATATGGGGGEGGGGGGEGEGDGGPNKPMSMSERARLARVPQPELGLNCPRCDSTNTKFCYFNNYSLTQPRHFCRACRRHWTRGGALCNVPVGGGYRRHAKRSTKPKATATGATAAAGGTSSATCTTPSSATTCTGSATATLPAGMQYSMFSNSAPPHGRFADGFDPASLGLSFPARLLFAENGAYASDGNGHHHQGNGMEQWAAVQMQSFPFLHAMDHQMAGNPPPTTMAAMQGMFHLGLQSGGGGGGNGENGGDH